MRQITRGIVRASVAALLGAAMAAPALAQNAPAQSGPILREGSGERRAALDAMEFQPFDRTLLAGLTDWVGNPIAAADLDGKPLLILTWASWHRGSTASARAAKIAYDAFADKGLIVVGVHSDEGYDTAATTAERFRLGYPVARDVGSKFRAALKADMDPNFYVVDRAGNLRFADAERASIREAARIVTEETREQAEAAKTASINAANQPAVRTIDVVSEGDVAQIPEWTIPPQPPIAYEDASWPARWREFEELAGTEFNRRGSRQLPVVDFNSQLITWPGPKPPMTGRVRVVYFWAHNLPASYDKVQTYMDELQRRHGRDVVVIGASIPAIRLSSRERDNPDAESEALEQFATTLINTLSRSNFKHAIALDREWELFTTSMGKNADFGGQMGAEVAGAAYFPIAVIYSTDNMVRWMGSPLNDRFAAALNKIIEVDPAVKIRRERDEQYLARQGGR